MVDDDLALFDVEPPATPAANSASEASLGGTPTAPRSRRSGSELDYVGDALSPFSERSTSLSARTEFTI